jgi:2-methylcitrate dehydratase
MPYDQVIVDIKDYVFHYKVEDPNAWACARTAVLDALGCAMESLVSSSECRSMLGPTVSGTIVADGFRLPGTQYQLDPMKGAFDMGTMIRYLDHNDAMGGADWGHPSGMLDIT